MLMVTTPRTNKGKQIFNTSNIMGLKVSIEPKKRSRKTIQVSGHGLAECTANYRCAFCARKHSSWNFKQDRGRGKCPKHPDRLKEQRQQRKEELYRNFRTNQGISYEDRVLRQQPNAGRTKNLASALTRKSNDQSYKNVGTASISL